MGDSQIVLRGRVVLPDRVVDDGVVVLAGDQIAFAGAAEHAPTGVVIPETPLRKAARNLILPGLVDVHNHGGGGASFPDATSLDEARTAIATHRNAGTTAVVASTVTASRPTLLARVGLLAQLVRSGELVGSHIEGPFLSVARRGAQSPEYLTEGDAGFVRELAAAGEGTVRSMTIAPEVPGVMGPGGALEALLAAGIIPSLGHTSCDFPEAEAMIAEVHPLLARRHLRMTATHLFNGMPPLQHRAPGPVGAALAAATRGDLVVELVADGVHLDPNTVRMVFALLGAENIALVTDAMAAAGMPDGEYQLGPMTVEVHGGVARLADPGGDGSIAGGTSRLLDQVRLAQSWGIPLQQAVRAASETPARAFSLTGRGTLLAGSRADVLVASPEFEPLQVYLAGKPLPPSNRASNENS